MRSGNMKFDNMKPGDVGRQPVGAAESFDDPEKSCASQ
jgi:hypothetical protein